MSNQPMVPFETTLLLRDTCLCLHVQRSARALARHFDDVLRPLGLTNGQFSLLMALNQPKPPGMGMVAALLAMDRTTLTAALKPLERRNLVQVTKDPKDRRGRLLNLMPEGLMLLSEAIPLWRQAHDAIEEQLGSLNAERLRVGLRTLATL
ncbi:MarR family winged helix-turn-helix transcriptional regulator [Beijerinckia indica]|nr:MarR family winged helix-turn-helix transcriptional regulator [Beijerinckia indica]